MVSQYFPACQLAVQGNSSEVVVIFKNLFTLFFKDFCLFYFFQYHWECAVVSVGVGFEMVFGQ